MVRIGITTSFEDHEQRLHHAYVQAVDRAGGLPLIVPMLKAKAMPTIANLLDGLVITGGPAITEGLIGTLPDDINETDPIRLEADVALLDAMLSAGKPILGICYGMQLLNAHFGGTIYADVEQQCPGTLVHSTKRGADEHPLRIQPGTTLHRLLGIETAAVNTRHIQAVAEVGRGFLVSGTAPDGTVEAIENEDGSLLGLQFHPERMGASMQPLFAHLVEQARSQTPALVT